MQIDFNKYEQNVSPCNEFGLYDIGNNVPVILDYANPQKWESTVECNNRKDYKFIPVDSVKELLEYKKYNSGTDTCDVILRTENTVCFVELKNQDKSWFQESMNQLKVTIGLYKDSHGIDTYKFRRAQAVNKTHPSFHVSMKNEMHKFWQDTTFTLRVGIKIQELR